MANIKQAFVLLSEASRLTGKSRRTIDRDIQIGKIHQTQVLREGSRKRISVAELERVYGKLASHDQDKRLAMSQDTATENTEILALLKAQLEAEKNRNRRAEDEIREWKERYFSVQEKLNTVLLPPPENEKRRGLFRRWFKK